MSYKKQLENQLKRFNSAINFSENDFAWLDRFLFSDTGLKLLVILLSGDMAQNVLNRLHQSLMPSNDDESIETLIQIHLEQAPKIHIEALYRLLVFPGSFTTKAAETILSGTQNSIEFWVTINFVIRLVNSENIRYEINPVLRSAIVKLQSWHCNPDPDVLTRFHIWCSNVVAEASGYIKRTPEKSHLKQLDLEIINLIEPIRTNAITNLSYSVGLWRWWYHRGRYNEGVEILKHAIIHADHDDPCRGEAYRAVGLLLHLCGKTNEAERYLKQAVVRGSAENKISFVVDALNDLGEMVLMRGQPQEANRFHNKALSLARKIEDDWATASSLIGLGHAFAAQERLSEALRLFDSARKIYERTNDTFQYAKVLSNSANIFKRLCDYQQAIRYLNQCLVIFDDYGDKRSYFASLFTLADCYWYIGDYEQSQDGFVQTLRLAHEMGYSNIGWLLVNNLALIACEMNDYQRAGVFFGASEKLRDEQETPIPVSPSEQNEFEQYRKLARAKTRADIWRKAISHGKTLSVEDVLMLFTSK